MLRINALKINVNTDKGLYGVYIPFSDGLNIIRGNNSSGKSTIFQSILYCLGLEEIIGSRNEKAMQSVLRNEVLNDNRIQEANVLESSILLEFSNGNEIITSERFVKSENIDSRFIKVYYGAFLTKEEKNVKNDPMYVHDSGGATDIKFGFHAYLEKFLGFNLPEVQYGDNTFRKLYLQTIFPTFVIEQKVGWSDFLATIPYYNLKDKEKRAIEFILKLDSWQIEEARQEIKVRKQEIERLWENEIVKVRDLARRSALEIVGLNNSPFIINEIENINLRYNKPDKIYGIDDYLMELRNEVEMLEKLEIPKIENISKEKERELNQLQETYNRLNIQYNRLFDEKNKINSNLVAIKERAVQIEQELTQNKHHLKVKKLGNLQNLKVANDLCPACGHELNDSLLPNSIEQIPMNIEENIGYLEAQKLMANTYIKNHNSDSEKVSNQLRSLEDIISQLRTQIRNIKKDLISDDRLPSVELIERRIKVKSRFDFYSRIRDEYEEIKEKILSLSKGWEYVLADEAKLPKESFSEKDILKLNLLNKEFITMVR